MSRLDNKVAVITGAGSGIGRAIALAFAKEGSKVVITCRTAETGEETVRMIKEASGKAMFIKTDVSKTEDVRNMVKTTVDTYGKLDVLVNNAAIVREEGSIVDCPEEYFDRIIAINLKGVWLGMKCAIPEMVKAGGGSIINVSAVGALEALPGIALYSASKGALFSLSRVGLLSLLPRTFEATVLHPGRSLRRYY